MGGQLNRRPRAEPRRPNLFIIGAMKCGTSSLHNYLGAHPEIFMCDPKEPCGLVAPEELRRHWPGMAELGFAGSRESYLGLFAAGGDCRYLGESSTLYTKLPEITGVPARLEELCPEARLIYIVRDPVERTISHYWHMVRQEGDRRDMLTAIRDDPRFGDVSNYAMQLEPYLERFGRERILVLTLEEMTASPGETLGTVAAWLGVDDAFELPAGAEPANVTPDSIEVEDRAGLERFRHSGLWSRLGPAVPKAIRKLGRRLATRTIERRAVDTGRVVEYLRPIQRRRSEDFSRLVGRRFESVWTTLYGG